MRRGVELLGSAFSELLWPTRCAACDMPGDLLCEPCRASLPWICQRFACPVCGAPYGFLTCTECKRDWETRCVVSAMEFQGAPARMASCLKDAHELRLAPVIAAAMACALEEAACWPAEDAGPRFSASTTDAVCFVPATRRAYVRRGFDHMELVARELCRETGLPFADLLVRSDAHDQRGLGREGRAENLAGTVGVVDDVSGLRILVVDDVVTTGSSLRESARALLARGASSVSGCSLARVW